jgi:hypothetical protein
MTDIIPRPLLVTTVKGVELHVSEELVDLSTD